MGRPYGCVACEHDHRAQGTAAYVGFKPEGHTVSVATWDGEVYELDTRDERWIAFACDVAGRNLTQAEWRETLETRPYRETCPS